MPDPVTNHSIKTGKTKRRTKEAVEHWRHIPPRGHFLPYRIKVDPRPFMATSKSPAGDKPAKSSFHHFVHPLCHQDTFASEEKLGS